MVRNELEFRDLVATLLQREGFVVKKEFGLPEGYRVDLLAIKEDIRSGIEVKLKQRGISDDISKASMLHKMPEFDHFYVAAPKILVSSDLVSYAKLLRIGILGVEQDSLEWLQESEKLKPAQLLGSGSIPNKVSLSCPVFEVTKGVKNHGGKMARDLEMFFMPSGPFVTAPKEKSRFKLARLGPEESWDVKFTVKIKKSAKPGSYPLYVSCTAKDMKPLESVWQIPVTL